MVEERQRAAYARGWSDGLAGTSHAYQQSNEALFFYEMGYNAAAAQQAVLSMTVKPMNAPLDLTGRQPRTKP